MGRFLGDNLPLRLGSRWAVRVGCGVVCRGMVGGLDQMSSAGRVLFPGVGGPADRNETPLPSEWVIFADCARHAGQAPLRLWAPRIPGWVQTTLQH